MKPAAYTPQQVQDLAGSGVSTKFALANGVVNIPNDQAGRETIRTALNWLSTPALSLGDFLAFFYHDAAGNRDGYVRVKAANPPPDKGRGGKPKKYIAPTGRPPRLYTPPAVVPMLADLTAPLVITEGEKKTLCLLANGFGAVGISGVDNWGGVLSPLHGREGDPLADRPHVIGELGGHRWGS